MTTVRDHPDSSPNFRLPVRCKVTIDPAVSLPPVLDLIDCSWFNGNVCRWLLSAARVFHVLAKRIRNLLRDSKNLEKSKMVDLVDYDIALEDEGIGELVFGPPFTIIDERITLAEKFCHCRNMDNCRCGENSEGMCFTKFLCRFLGFELSFQAWIGVGMKNR